MMKENSINSISISIKGRKGMRNFPIQKMTRKKVHSSNNNRRNINIHRILIQILNGQWYDYNKVYINE